MKTRKLKTLRKTLLRAAVIVALLALALPRSAEFFANRAIAAALPPGFAAELRILRLGLRGAKASFALDSNGSNMLSVNTIRLRYSLAGLLARDLGEIAISGVTARLDADMVLPPAAPAAANAAANAAAPAAPAAPPPPLTLAPLAKTPIKFKLTADGVCVLPLQLPLQRESLQIPFQLAARSDGAEDGAKLRVSGKASLGASAAEAVAVLDPATDSATLQLLADFFAASLPTAFALPPPASALTLTNIALSAEVRLAPQVFFAKGGGVLTLPQQLGGPLLGEITLHPELTLVSRDLLKFDAALSLAEINDAAATGGVFRAGPVAVGAPSAEILASVRADAGGALPAITGGFGATAEYNGIPIATATARLSTSNAVIQLDAPFKIIGIEGAAAVRLDTATAAATATLAIPKQTFDTDAAPLPALLAALAPDLKGARAAGQIEATATYAAPPSPSAGGAPAAPPAPPSGAFRASFRDFNFDWAEKEISATNIYATLALPELPNLAVNSLGVGFKSLKVGTIELDSGGARFRALPPDTFFMDSLSLNWCDGKIRAESMRFSTSNQTIRMTLHGDRIRLSKLLGQLGVGHDTGQTGSLSGTIPVVITRDSITFRDGYLHSTPGERGYVKLAPSDTVKDVASASTETSLAIDALSDFSYQWLRLGLDTKDGDLLIRLGLDGQPATKLFYTVDRGEILRSTTANTFEGLSLDANFRLPLNAAIPLLRDLIDELP